MGGLSDAKIEGYLALNPKQFCYLKAMRLERVIDDRAASPYSLTIQLAAEPEIDADVLELCFEGVRRLELRPTEGLLALLIEIRRRPDNSIGADYFVTESEYDSLRFECDDFSFSVLASSDPALSGR